MKLYIMRHGESYSNIGGKMVSSQDTELTPRGIAQVQAAKDYINLDFDHVFSSPLKRAKQTADIMAGDTPVEIYDDLREMVVGLLEGLSFFEIEEKFPGVDSGKGLATIQFPEGESFDCISARCKGFISQAMSNLPTDANVLVVCHGMTKRVLVNILLNRPNHHVNHLNWCDNTAFTVLDMSDTPKLVHLNYFNHLVAGDLRTEGFHTWGKLSDEDYGAMGHA